MDFVVDIVCPIERGDNFHGKIGGDRPEAFRYFPFGDTRPGDERRIGDTQGVWVPPDQVAYTIWEREAEFIRTNSIPR